MQKLTDIDSNKLAEQLIDTINNKKIQMVVNDEQTETKITTECLNESTLS